MENKTVPYIAFESELARSVAELTKYKLQDLLVESK